VPAPGELARQGRLTYTSTEEVQREEIMASARKAKSPAPKAGVTSTARGPSPGGKGPAADQIAARAYQIWLENGCPKGRDDDHWFQAERELREGSSK
jgi:hypothetical protein